MHRRWHFVLGGILLSQLLLATVLGCGKSSNEFSVVEARGHLTIDGKPIGNATVVFAPQEGPSATAETDSGGAFVLRTYKDGDGAVAGQHTVTIEARESGHEDMKGSPLMMVPGKSLIPASYADPTTSGLKFEVKAGQSNDFDIKLSSQQ